jgi:predicted nucleotidyltransferase
METPLELPRDFKECVESLLENEVEFMIVGGYALSAHGRPRYTGDIDFFVKKSPDNAERIVKALHEFFGPLPEIKKENFLEESRMSQFGVEPLRIDFLVEISGVEFDDAFARRELIQYSGLQVPFISLADLLANKRASGRPKDLGDVEAFSQIDPDQ